jgi:hypothetical protein
VHDLNQYPTCNLAEPDEEHNLQLVPVPDEHHEANGDQASIGMSVCATDGIPASFKITVLNTQFPNDEFKDDLSQAVIIIPASFSDLGDESVVSAATAPSILNINVNLEGPVKSTLSNETAKDVAIVSSTSSDADTEKQPPKRFKSSASYADLMEQGMDFEEKDTFDRIRIASAGMDFVQGKQNPLLQTDRHPSFGVMIDKTKWFHRGKSRACPRGGWLTRMARGDETATPNSTDGVYRTTNGFTFQC